MFQKDNELIVAELFLYFLECIVFSPLAIFPILVSNIKEKGIIPVLRSEHHPDELVCDPNVLRSTLSHWFDSNMCLGEISVCAAG